MAANKIGALAVTSGDTETGDVIGVISERDYLNKVGLLGRKSKETQVKEICTMGKANLVSVTLDNPIDKCMKKMIDHNVRHLLVRQKDTGNMVGMISVKDIVKCTIAKHDAQLNKLHSHLVEATVMKGL
jgi:CBS domain-containing protein